MRLLSIETCNNLYGLHFQITCHDNKDGTVSVSYLPTAPGEYKVTVRFGDKHIKGSPFLAKASSALFITGIC